MKKQLTEEKLKQIKTKLKSNLEIKRAKAEREKAISNYKTQLKIAKEEAKKLKITLKKNKKEKLKKENQVDSKYKQELKDLNEKLKQNLIFLKKEKERNKQRIKLAKQELINKKRELILKQKKDSKNLQKKIDEEIKKIKLKKVKMQNDNLKEMIALKKENANLEIKLQNEELDSEKKLLKTFDEIKKDKIKLKKIEVLDEEEKLKETQKRIEKNKLFQVEKEIELKLFKQNLAEEEIKIQKDLLMSQKLQKEKIDSIKEKELIDKLNIKEIDVKKVNHSSRIGKVLSPNSEFSYENIYIPKRKNKFIKFHKTKSAYSSNVYKNKRKVFNEVSLFEKIIKKEKPIDIRSIIRATFVYFDKIFNEEIIDHIYRIQMLALISGYSLALKNQFIKFLNKKYKKFIVLDYIKKWHFSPFTEKEKEFYNNLIDKKLDYGSVIMLYDNLLLLKEEDKLITVEGSKFKG